MNSDTSFPSVIFGTSSLGNLYEALDESIKKEIVKECITHGNKPVVFDTAGKYGAGLSLESLGKILTELKVSPEDVMISNKLGWFRIPLETEEPTFEPGVWKGLKYDAVQKISYEGILECFEQGNELLQGYVPQLVSVHDPDEYLAKAKSEEEAAQLYQDVLDAYKALTELKEQGRVKSIGVGAKDWKVIEKIAKDVKLDWVMIANSMTIMHHPDDLLTFMKSLEKDGVKVINSAVFHGGFLVGGDFFNYKLVQPDTEENKALFRWRDVFFSLCNKYDIKPAVACVQFGIKAPGVVGIALNTTHPRRVKSNIESADTELPSEFWNALKKEGLLEEDYQFV